MAVYTVPFDNLAVTTSNDQNIWQLDAPADAAVKIHHFELYSATTTDERARLRLMRYATTGSGGTASTEASIDGTSATHGSAVTHLRTTPGTDGAVLLAWYWSQLSPLVYLPTPENRIIVPPSGIIGLHLETTLAAERNWSGFLVFEEIG